MLPLLLLLLPLWILLLLPLVLLPPQRPARALIVHGTYFQPRPSRGPGVHGVYILQSVYGNPPAKGMRGKETAPRQHTHKEPSKRSEEVSAMR